LHGIREAFIFARMVTATLYFALYFRLAGLLLPRPLLRLAR
jgi:hypothetical protein